MCTMKRSDWIGGLEFRARLLSAVALLACVLGGAPSEVARADASARTHPDLVQMKDGGFFRGTILELVPGEYVLIETASGELRRIEASGTEYIGPAERELADPESDPDAEPEAVGVADGASSEGRALELHLADGVPVRIFSDEGRLTLHALESFGVAASSRYGAGGVFYTWRPVCTTPCEANLAPGVYPRLLIAGERGRSALVRHDVRLDGPSDLLLHYESRRKVRAVLLSLGVTLSAAGLATLMGAAFRIRARCDDPALSCGLNWGAFGSGVAMLFAGIGLTFPGFSVRDRGEITVHPLGALGSFGPEREDDAMH